mgnify:CR=1 FL=1
MTRKEQIRLYAEYFGITKKEAAKQNITEEMANTILDYNKRQAELAFLYD